MSERQGDEGGISPRDGTRDVTHVGRAYSLEEERLRSHPLPCIPKRMHGVLTCSVDEMRGRLQRGGDRTEVESQF